MANHKMNWHVRYAVRDLHGGRSTSICLRINDELRHRYSEPASSCRCGVNSTGRTIRWRGRTVWKLHAVWWRFPQLAKTGELTADERQPVALDWITSSHE